MFESFSKCRHFSLTFPSVWEEYSPVLLPIQRHVFSARPFGCPQYLRPAHTGCCESQSRSPGCPVSSRRTFGCPPQPYKKLVALCHFRSDAVLHITVLEVLCRKTTHTEANGISHRKFIERMRGCDFSSALPDAWIIWPNCEGGTSTQCHSAASWCARGSWNRLSATAPAVPSVGHKDFIES